MQSQSLEATETDRRLANVVRIGTVFEADYQKARVRVAFGSAVSDWLPWVTFRAGGDHTWWAPEVGEQVVVLSPSGEPSSGAVLGSLFSTDHPAPADRPTIHRTTYEDGAVIEYDRKNHILHAYVPGDALLEVDHDAKVIAKNDIKATSAEGNIDVTAENGVITVKALTDNIKVIAEKGNIDVLALEGSAMVKAKGEAALVSETKARISAPEIELDGPFVQGKSTHGGGGEFYGEIKQYDGDFISDGVSQQHHKHRETGSVTEEPIGGAS